MSDSKNEILTLTGKAIRRRIFNNPATPDMTGEIYESQTGSLSERFKTELELVNGSCILCSDIEDLRRKIEDYASASDLDKIFCLDDSLNELLKNRSMNIVSSMDQFKNMDAAITPCEFLIARTGSVMVSSGLSSGRRLNVFPPVHMVVSFTSRLVYDIGDAYAAMIKKYPAGLPSMISLITGPSRTADIEKTLILGAHGPKQMIVFVVED